METLLNSIASFITNIANGVAPACVFMFFEPEVPESLREE
ncbi:cyclic lactone autoinducer peptide [Romboutsia sp.]